MSRTCKDTKKGKDAIMEKYNTWPVGGISSIFKKLRRRSRRAKEKEAMQKDKEMPIFKKDDAWDWW
jgi:hypothetical protein